MVESLAAGCMPLHFCSGGAIMGEVAQGLRCPSTQITTMLLCHMLCTFSLNALSFFPAVFPFLLSSLSGFFASCFLPFHTFFPALLVQVDSQESSRLYSPLMAATARASRLDVAGDPQRGRFVQCMALLLAAGAGGWAN